MAACGRPRLSRRHDGRPFRLARAPLGRPRHRATANRSAASRAPRAASGARHADTCAANAAGVIMSIAPRGRSNREAVAVAAGASRTGKGQQEIPVARRLVGDQHDAGDARDAVGVLLKRRVPEILRIMLLADGEMDVGRALDRRRRRARSRPSPAEPSGRLPSRSKRITSEPAMPAARNAASSARASLRFQNEHREPLAALQEIAIEGAEQNGKAVVCRACPARPASAAR